jgi:hypothetical protein
LLLLFAQVDGRLAWRRLVRQVGLQRPPSIPWRGVVMGWLLGGDAWWI